MNYIRHPFHSTPPTNGAVRFSDPNPPTKKINEREKYLTAKYPQQQMQLIRKRLKVEFWLDDQLKLLYNIKDDSAQEDHDQCPEDLIDSLLDMDNDFERRTFLLEKLRNVKQSRSITMAFIEEFLYRVKTL